MKPYSIIAAIVASALLAAGCTGIGQSISLDSEPGILAATGGTTDFTFTPPYAWSADIRTDEGVDSWISINPTSGDASRQTVTVSAGPNERADSRIAFIDISSGDQFLSVQITQLGTDDETPGGDIEAPPVEIPATYIRHIRILDPSEGNEDNFSFEYDGEGRVTTIRGDSRLDDEYSMYYYTISYGKRSVSITGDDGINVEATLDSEGRATEVEYSETYDGREYASDITLTYDSEGRLVKETSTDGYSESVTDYIWTDGNIARVHYEYYDTDYLYSSYPNTGNIDINWLMTGGYGSGIAPLGIIGMLGTRCTDYAYPDYWDAVLLSPDQQQIAVSEDDLDKPVEKEGFYYEYGEPEISYLFEGPEGCLSYIHMEKPLEQVHYLQTGIITDYDPYAYEIREDGKKYYYVLTIEWGEREETYRETVSIHPQEVTVDY
ncbi:MAG TPA: DUF4595 domain-containing protein [Candidatus Cryptobacteroides merdipullorum]|uniref:DUF4595 domain-containing protein n=1 Tax=Candidatus Cryptobacteroides merdipullorum TaxID=2840771 RepID=A0A9D1GLP3_9BACT|nr:DUF4595 domain-containing protein [Candidatus Cryptobacteroides merdipullorum]